MGVAHRSDRAAIALILAGGMGQRMRPVTRDERPKQFLNLILKDQSLLQATAKRVSEIPNVRSLWIVSGERFRDEVKRQLPQLPPTNLILEPVGRGTGPSIVWATLEVAEGHPMSQVMLFTPSDHWIENENAFHGVVSSAIELAAQTKQIILIGVAPTYASTEYGYIKKAEIVTSSKEIEAHRVQAYIEKPMLQLANQLVNSGDYYWNSGILISRVDVLLQELRRVVPKTVRLLETGGLNAFYDLQPFSIEHTVLQTTENAVVVPGDFGWHDIGTLDSLVKLSATTETNFIGSGGGVPPDSDPSTNPGF
ncbi:MAG: mannose-phosphate guanylyltransferase [Pyrinomonadaceae bacterium]|jgi:mannose-1-phosphate guanylyltransferase|nr:mannose-phosphate guanylyltransferase [Pyrinomonadaceae bacterium]